MDNRGYESDTPLDNRVITPLDNRGLDGITPFNNRGLDGISSLNNRGLDGITTLDNSGLNGITPLENCAGDNVYKENSSPDKSGSIRYEGDISLGNHIHERVSTGNNSTTKLRCEEELPKSKYGFKSDSSANTSKFGGDDNTVHNQGGYQHNNYFDRNVPIDNRQVDLNITENTYTREVDCGISPPGCRLRTANSFEVQDNGSNSETGGKDVTLMSEKELPAVTNNCILGKGDNHIRADSIENDAGVNTNDENKDAEQTAVSACDNELGGKPENVEYKKDMLVLDPVRLITGQAQDEIGSLLEKPEVNGHPKVLIERSLFSQKHFDENFEAGSRPSPTFRQIILKKLSKCRCSGVCLKQFLYTLFPFINIMKNYNIKEDITGDIVSGLTVGIMHIPQGMAYGMLTTLPPVFGLYMSFFPVLLYFFFGSSKHVSMGTFAVACLMIGSAVSKGMDSLSGSWAAAGLVPSISENSTAMNQTGNYTQNQTDSTTTTGAVDDISGMSPEELDLRLQFAMSVTFMVGVIQLIMGFFRLGFITVYLSDPLISGFTTGAACHVFTSQIKHVFGVKTARYSGVFKLVYTYRDFFTNIETTNIVTLLLSVVCVAVLYCTSRFINQNPKLKPKMFMPVPIELIVVVLGTVVSYALNLENTHDVIVVSDIPTGLPVPNTKCFTRISSVISDAIALAIVIFAISISMGKLLAKKHDYEVDANQELMAYGISTVVSSFFSSAAPSASLSRSLVQERVGGRTQVAGLISCCLLLVVLLAIGPYFRTLPNAVLASIIIVALRGMFLQVLDLKKLWRVSLIDFFVWIVAFLATVLLDVDLGLGAAVVFNLVTVVCRSQRPYACLLGQMPGTDIYRDMSVYQEAREVPGVKIFRFEHSLFFVNTEHFRTLLYKRTANPRTLKIAQKKREAKMAKMLKKKKDLVIVGENVPDVSIPIDSFDMEIDNTGQEVKATDSLKPRHPLDVDFHTIIFDCSPWSFVDSMAVKVLSSVVGEYKAIGVKVILANCKAGIREMFQKTKFYDTLDHSNIYVSLHDAVIQAIHPESPAPALQADVSEVGTSLADRDDSVTDYNIDFMDDESVQGKTKQGSKASSSRA